MMQPLDSMHDSVELDRRFRQRHRAWRIIAFMRWVTMVLGPAALLVDEILVPLLLRYDVPDVVTFEDLMQWLVLSVLPLDLWIDIELFHTIYFHVTKYRCHKGESSSLCILETKIESLVLYKVTV